MKLQIRTGLFETNSSSTHSLTMCTKDDYEAFKRGDKLYDYWDGRLVDANNLELELDEDDVDNDGRYYTFERFEEDILNNYEEDMYHEFITPLGETVVAFGYAGHDW